MQAASGEAAEEARLKAMAENKGKYVVVVDGAVSAKDGGVYSTSAGQTNLDMLKDTVKDALAVVAVGSCASFGGIPKANPNPTGAGPASDFVTDKPVINISGCPPIAEAMAGTIAYMISFGKLPELDHLGRPKAFFGETIHDRCYRRPFYERGEFADSFDDDGARRGYCLYKVGCKGPVTYNSCATLKWNGGVSFPIQSGHGCLGCSEPDFWDQGGFYRPLSASLSDFGLPLAAAGARRRRARRRRRLDRAAPSGEPRSRKRPNRRGTSHDPARFRPRAGARGLADHLRRRDALALSRRALAAVAAHRRASPAPARPRPSSRR